VGWENLHAKMAIRCSAVEIERQQKVHCVVNYKQQKEIAFY
jgi:hypothetical protein